MAKPSRSRSVVARLGAVPGGRFDRGFGGGIGRNCGSQIVGQQDHAGILRGQNFVDGISIVTCHVIVPLPKNACRGQSRFSPQYEGDVNR